MLAKSFVNIFGRNFNNIAYVMVCVMLFSFLCVYAENTINPKANGNNIYPISLNSGEVVTQNLKPTKMNLEGFSIQFGTYNRRNKGALNVRLFEDALLLQQWDLNTENFADNKYQEFMLDKPRKITKQNQLRVELQNNYEGENNLALYVIDTPENNYKVSEMENSGSIAINLQGDLPIKYRFIWFSLSAVLLVFFMLLKRWQNVKIMSVIFLLVGICYLFHCPNDFAPDANGHFYKAYAISEGDFISQHLSENGKVGNIQPRALYDFTDKTAVVDENDIVEIINLCMALYSPVSYIPQAIGVKIARIFTNHVKDICTVARIINFLICAAICILALRLMPFGKQILFFILLMPISMQELTSLAADSFTLSLIYLFIAYVLYLHYVKPKISGKDVIWLTILCSAIALCKIVYVLILALLYMLPNNKIENKTHKILIKAFIPILALVLNLIWLSLASGFLTEYNPGVNSGEQVRYILSHPFTFLFVLQNSIFERGNFVLDSLFSHLLGCFTVVTNWIVYIGCALTFIYQISRIQDIKVKISSNLGWLFIFLFLSIVGLIYTTLYVQWTPVGAEVIEGVQGRYFLPVLPLLGLFVIYQNHKDKVYCISDYKYLYMLTLFFNGLALADIVAYYL